MTGYVPSASRYNAGALPVSISSKRRTVRLIPRSSGEYTPSGTNVIRIDLPPSVGFLDTSQSYLSFKLEILNTGITAGGDKDQTASAPLQLDGDASSWIQRFELISAHGTQLEYIDNYNLLCNMLHKANMGKDYGDSTARITQGHGEESYRAGHADAARTYCIGFDCSGILGSQAKYIPLKYIQGAIQLELQLADAKRCCIGPAGVNYKITNVEYVAECIQFEQDFEAVFQQQLMVQGIDVYFDSYTNHNVILENNSGEQTHMISQSSRSVKSAYCVTRKTANISNNLQSGLTTYAGACINTYQFDLGGRLFPEFRNNCEDNCARVYSESLKSFNKFRDVSGSTKTSTHTYSSNTHEPPVYRRNFVTRWRNCKRQNPGTATEVNDTYDNAVGTGTNATRMAQAWFKEPHYLSAHTSAGEATLLNNNGTYTFEFQNPAEANSAAVLYPTDATQKWLIAEVVDDYSIIIMKKPTANSGALDATTDIGAITVNTLTNLGWLNYYASDKDFYIGCNFESHGEHSKMISGLDLTNSVPLHLNLNLSNQPGSDTAGAPAQPVAHQMSVFVHHDSLLRIEPTGEVTTASH